MVHSNDFPMLRLSCGASVWQVRNRNSEEYNVLKIQLEGIIEELERHFEQVGWHASNAALMPGQVEVAGGACQSAAVPLQHLMLLLQGRYTHCWVAC